MMFQRFAAVSMAVLLVFLSACASLETNFDLPSVKLVSIQPQKSQGLEQSFDIGLRITNPNPIALKLIGVEYDLELDGYKLVSGLANNVPSIPAYGDALITVQASVNLLQGARFLGSLFGKSNQALEYSINAKLDTGLPIIGKVAVGDSGAISLSDL